MNIDRDAIRTIVTTTRDRMSLIGQRFHNARLQASDRIAKGQPAPLPYSRVAANMKHWDQASLNRFEHGRWIPSDQQLEEIMDFIEAHP